MPDISRINGIRIEINESMINVVGHKQKKAGMTFNSLIICKCYKIALKILINLMIITSSTPIFLHASRKLSTFRLHRAIVNFGCKNIKLKVSNLIYSQLSY